ncbi:MAG: hypothetical protein ACRC33_25270 [Gemmataceae bacterium]
MAEAVEDVADGLARRHLLAQSGDRQEGTAGGLGGDPSIGERGLEFGVGLGLGIGDLAEVVGQAGARAFSLVAATGGEGVEAADAGAEFVQAGMDGVAAPTEGGLRAAGGPAAVGTGHLSLVPPPLAWLP